MSEVKEKEGLTRSKVLKRAGVGAAALWAAPVFVSAASASTEANVSGKTCVKLALNGSQAGGLTPCDYGDSPARPCPCHVGGFVGPVCDPQGSGRCICFLDVTGKPQCRDLSQIGSSCTSNGQCPAGWKCSYTCLDACPGGVGCCDDCTGNNAPTGGASGSGLVCLPPCSKTGSKANGISKAALKVARASR